MKPGSRLAVLLAFALLSSAADRKPEAYAVIAGTVFRGDGFSLPGASVTLTAKDALKRKKRQAVSDARGEFAFRVPAGAGSYIVKAAAKGFQAIEKEATVAGEERVEVTLLLAPESK